MEVQIQRNDSIIKIRFRGPLYISKETFIELIKDRKDILSILKDIEKMGWEWSLWNVMGEGIAEIDLAKATFEFKEYIPEDWMRELRSRRDRFWFEIDLGEERPKQVEILSVLNAEIKVIIDKDKDVYVEINPFRKAIVGIPDLFWDAIPRRRATLDDARRLYDAVMYFLEHGFKIESKYVMEKFQKLSQRIKPEYTFSIRLALTIVDPKKVPNWETLVEELYKFFRERGIAAKIEKEKSFLKLFEKPIP